MRNINTIIINNTNVTNTVNTVNNTIHNEETRQEIIGDCYFPFGVGGI